MKNYDTFVKDKCQWKTGFFHVFWAFFMRLNETSRHIHFPRINSKNKTGVFHYVLNISSCMKMKNHDKFSKDKFLQKNWGFPWSFFKCRSFGSTNFGLFWSYTNDQYLAVNKANEFEFLHYSRFEVRLFIIK